MSKRNDWVVVGPEPHFGHCTRCGKTIPKPTLPCPIDMAVAWINAAVKMHNKCKPQMNRESSRAPAGGPTPA